MTAAHSQQQDSCCCPSVASGSDSTGTTNAQSATITSGNIIPNKSTISKEEIEDPYGRGESMPEDGHDETNEVKSGLGALTRRLGMKTLTLTVVHVAMTTMIRSLLGALVLQATVQLEELWAECPQ
jgi:hypothetical protein